MAHRTRLIYSLKNWSVPTQENISQPKKVFISLLQNGDHSLYISSPCVLRCSLYDCLDSRSLIFILGSSFLSLVLWRNNLSTSSLSRLSYTHCDQWLYYSLIGFLAGAVLEWQSNSCCCKFLNLYDNLQKIGHVNSIPTTQFSTQISKNTQSKSYMLSLTECV